MDGEKKKCHKGNCHNCSKVGHWARECYSAKKKKDESTATLAMLISSTTYKPKNKPMGSTNAIMAHDYKGDGFWIAEEEAVDLAPIVSMELDSILDAPKDFEDAPHLKGEKMLLDEKKWLGAVITSIEETDSYIHIKLYDSGAIQHISPYKSDFTSYAPL